jgi:hypothetical protein
MNSCDCHPLSTNLAHTTGSALPLGLPQDCEVIVTPGYGGVVVVGFTRPPLASRECCAEPPPPVTPHFEIITP